MKRIVLITLTIALAFVLVGCGSKKATSTPAAQSTQTQQAAPAAEPEEDKSICSKDGYTVEIVAAHKTEDDNGDPIAAIELLFTNDNSEPAYLMQVADVKLFQGGVEMNKSEMYLTNAYDWDTFYTEVKDGATITVFRAAPLQNPEGEVEIQVSLYNLNGQTIGTASKTITLD